VNSNADLNRRFKMWKVLPHHPGGLLALQYRTVAQALASILPDGREKSKALNRLEESMMWARESMEH
jgi:hypothetical protein